MYNAVTFESGPSYCTAPWYSTNLSATRPVFFPPKTGGLKGFPKTNNKLFKINTEKTALVMSGEALQRGSAIDWGR